MKESQNIVEGLPRSGIKGIIAAKEGERRNRRTKRVRIRKSFKQHLNKSTIWKNYREGKEQGLSREEIKQEYGMREGEIALVERCERIVEDYDYGNLNVEADNIIKIEEWCKEQFEGKPKYSRRTPRVNYRWNKSSTRRRKRNNRTKRVRIREEL